MRGQFQVQLYLTSRGEYGWRLLSGNNREVGRCVSTFADEGSCRAALAVLRARADEFDGRVRRTPPNRWTWELRAPGDDGGAAVAVAGHTFDRMIRCEQSLVIFRNQFAAAGVSASVADCGARRWTAIRGGAA